MNRLVTDVRYGVRMLVKTPSATAMVLIALSLGVLVYAYWPSNKQRFDDAARNIIHDEDKPCR